MTLLQMRSLPPIELPPGAPAIRVGVVSFLNSRPLVWALEQEPSPAMVLSYDHPAALAHQLRAGEIDIGLVPVAEALDGAGVCAIDGISIASDGPVWSVKLLSTKAPARGRHDLKRIGVDHRSCSSVALLRALLAQHKGPEPIFEEIDPFTDIGSDGTPRDAALDGILVIGDRALDFAGGWDLGAEWTRVTGLPFVYALWMARNRQCATAAGARLRVAREIGLEHLDRFIANDDAFRERDRAFMRRYLTEAIDFRWTDRHRRALVRFGRAIGATRSIEFVSSPAEASGPTIREKGQSLAEFVITLVLVSLPVILTLEMLRLALIDYLHRLAITVSIPFV